MVVFRYVVATFVLAIPVLSFAAQKEQAEPVIVGYLFPDNQVLQSGQIDPHGLTRINYAFANIENGRMVAGEPNDPRNFVFLKALKAENPSLKVLVSVGGWMGSNDFSDMALTARTREVFIQSAVEFIKLYDLDGLDVDWEYPGLTGSGHKFRSEDKQNFTYLLKELRDRFDKEAKITGKRLYLTIAMGALDEVIEHTEMATVQQYVDTVNLMTYDYYESSGDKITGNHAPLFENPADPKKASADETVRAYEKAGVPAEKILLGVPFYGRMWGKVPEQNNGLFQPGKPIANAYATYNVIAGSMLNQGFTRHWDSASSVPYLYSPEKRIFVSYEDPESLKAKCNYVLSHDLGGVMFWEYFGDNSGQLLGAINQALHAKQ